MMSYLNQIKKYGGSAISVVMNGLQQSIVEHMEQDAHGVQEEGPKKEKHKTHKS